MKWSSQNRGINKQSQIHPMFERNAKGLFAYHWQITTSHSYLCLYLNKIIKHQQLPSKISFKGGVTIG